MSLRYAIYCRVSTDAQERDGTSLETQEDACRAAVAQVGGIVVNCTREAASGYSLGRTGLTELRQLIRDGKIDVLLCHDVDRLSRQQNHMGVLFDEVQTGGARLDFVLQKFENTAVGRFILSTKAFIAEVEREKIIERTTRGKIRRAQQGQLVQGTGKGFYGYTLSARGRGGDGRRTIEPEQATVVRRIFNEFVQGRSVHAIAQDLNRDGIETLHGWETTAEGQRLRQIPWHPLTVRRMLINETYTGRTTYRRTKVTVALDSRTGKRRRRVIEQPEEEWIDVPGATPALIEREQWARVQQLLSDPPQRQRSGHSLYPYPLAGHLRCDGCQGGLHGSTLSGGSGRNRIRYYGCRNRNLFDRSARCRSRYVRAEMLERRLVAGLRRVLADPAEIVSAYNYLNASTSNVESGAIERAQQRLAAVEQQVRQLARLARFADDDSVADALAEELKLAVREKKAAQDALDHLVTRNRPLPRIVADQVSLAELSERVAAWLDPNDLTKMKLVLEGLEITVWAGTGEPKATGSLPVHATCELHGDADVRAVVTNVDGQISPGTLIRPAAD